MFRISPQPSLPDVLDDPLDAIPDPPPPFYLMFLVTTLCHPWHLIPTWYSCWHSYTPLYCTVYECTWCFLMTYSLYPWPRILCTFSLKLSKKCQQGQRNNFGEKIPRGAKHPEFNADFKSVDKIGNIRKGCKTRFLIISDKSWKSPFFDDFFHLMSLGDFFADV